MVNILIDTHHVIYNVSLSDGFLDKESVDLVVTSPPYPMVAMWDECFKGQNSLIQKYLDIEEYNIAWMEMHRVLNNIWREIVYCVKPGGFVCINIGDATRRMVFVHILMKKKKCVRKVHIFIMKEIFGFQICGMF